MSLDFNISHSSFNRTLLHCLNLFDQIYIAHLCSDTTHYDYFQLKDFQVFTQYLRIY